MVSKQFLGAEAHSGVSSKAEGILPLMVVAFAVALSPPGLLSLPSP